ncbi:MAG: glutathione S-transferase family protein, partial [Candidatus Binatia bacterium]
VRMFAAAKGVELELQEVDLMGGENRRAPYTDKNPGAQLPALELGDGSVLSEVTAICEYLDEVGPEPSLVGSSPLERARTRMWARRVDLNVCEPMANGFRFAEGLPIFEGRMHVIPQAADDLKQIARERLAWLDGLMEGKDFLAGQRFTMADVLLYAFLDFFSSVGQPLDDELSRLGGWFERVGSRPSAEASLHPASAAAGMRG